LVIPPGESKSGRIEVENPSEESIVIKAYLQDWVYSASHNGTKEFFSSGTTSLSGAGWISFSLSDFVVPAFGKQVISYTVKVPPGARGGRYAALFFESLLAKPELRDTASLGVMVRIGALFYIEPEGTIHRLAEVSGLSLERKSKDKPLHISLKLKNSGNTDVTCKGTFHMMNKQGMVSARGEFNEAYMFAGETAELSATWKESLPRGKYDVILTLDIGKAMEEANLGRGPVITKEVEIEIADNGQVSKVGELK
jgi:hypothetical protein